jgi:hypothetical protein
MGIIYSKCYNGVIMVGGFADALPACYAIFPRHSPTPPSRPWLSSPHRHPSSHDSSSSPPKLLVHHPTQLRFASQNADSHETAPLRRVASKTAHHHETAPLRFQECPTSRGSSASLPRTLREQRSLPGWHGPPTESDPGPGPRGQPGGVRAGVKVTHGRLGFPSPQPSRCDYGSTTVLRLMPGTRH